MAGEVRCLSGGHGGDGTPVPPSFGGRSCHLVGRPVRRRCECRSHPWADEVLEGDGRLILAEKREGLGGNRVQIVWAVGDGLGVRDGKWKMEREGCQTTQNKYMNLHNDEDGEQTQQSRFVSSLFTLHTTSKAPEALWEFRWRSWGSLRRRAMACAGAQWPASA